MPDNGSRLKSGRGITVLSLLLVIIGLVIVAIFLVRYLRSRPAVSSGSPTSLLLSPQEASPHQPFDQLDLAGVIQIVRGNPVDLLGVGPYPSG